jgi:4-diphosphocytidyl-2-C-methyl-D-erythritol kinase
MSIGEKACWIHAPAKINLTLEVLGRRPDGYHEIRSLLMPLALADRIEIREAAQEVFEVVPDGVDLAVIGPASDNLAVRAANLVRERAGVSQPLALRIVKRIPVGGGLGGGSADAAAILVALNQIWNLGWSRAELRELGLQLGSDVPALIEGGAVCMKGRGERVAAVWPGVRERIRPFPVLLVNPGIPVSTAEAYRSCSGVLTSERNSYTIFHSALLGCDVTVAAKGLFNGLEAGVFLKYPAVERVAQLLKAAGAPGVLMSGSGATVFALVEDVEQGERIRRDLPGGYWSRITWTLPDGVMAAHGFLEP